MRGTHHIVLQIKGGCQLCQWPAMAPSKHIVNSKQSPHFTGGGFVLGPPYNLPHVKKSRILLSPAAASLQSCQALVSNLPLCKGDFVFISYRSSGFQTEQICSLL